MMMNISLLHHWLVSMRGGEKVLEQFCRLMPGADIHTLVRSRNDSSLNEAFRDQKIYTTLLDKLPGAESNYKSLLPFFPVAIKSHQVDADFILSSDASMIKGMTKKEETPHVCYCHSPPRYLWDMQEEYLNSMSAIKAAVFKKLTPYLQNFDLEAADKVDHFIANSQFVRSRIKKIYGKESVVIHPPVDLESFKVHRDSEDFYLIVSALVPYKKVELAVRAFNELGKKLVIIGEGSEKKKLKSLADANISILGSQPFEILKQNYAKCKAFIFPGVEDFGITPLEAQASGKPVIAFRKGGALETITEGETGIFFDAQNVESLIEAVERFEKEKNNFFPEVCRKNAEHFSPTRFKREIKDFLISRYPSYFSGFKWDGIQ